MKNVVVYPRGFFSFDIGLPVQRDTTDIKKLMESIRFNKQYVTRDRTVISNDEIETLYVKSYKNEAGVRTMEFRERILRTALGAFGTQSFYEWCELQLDNPYFSSMHRRFLNDTFQFIQTGERNINIDNWDKLVTVKKTDNSDQKVPFLYKDFFKMNQVALFRRPFTITNLVQSWVSQPGGFEDMTRSLRIVFCDNPHL